MSETIRNVQCMVDFLEARVTLVHIPASRTVPLDENHTDLDVMLRNTLTSCRCLAGTNCQLLYTRVVLAAKFFFFTREVWVHEESSMKMNVSFLASLFNGVHNMHSDAPVTLVMCS